MGLNNFGFSKTLGKILSQLFIVQIILLLIENY